MDGLFLQSFGYWWAAVVVTIDEVYTIRNIIKGRQSERWPPVTAEITDAFSKNWFGRRTPVVRYRYDWLGASYVGSRIAFARVVVPSKASADAFLRQFRVGSTIDVRVNPNRPMESVLRSGNRFQNWVEAVGAAAFGVLAAFFAFGG